MPAATSASELRRPSVGSRCAPWLWTLLVLLSCEVCLRLSGAELGKLFDPAGVANARDILGGLLHPDLSADFLHRVLALSVESLLIGLLGTVLAVVIGFGLAWLATAVPTLPDPPRQPPVLWRLAASTLRWAARFTLGLLRAIPEIVWAYIFVRLLGLGPGAAVLAIALTSGGGIGKVWAELAEAVEPRGVQALRASGASRAGVLAFAVLPQVRRPWVAYALFRLECNIRNGTILGVVGAGGLGSEIALSIRYFQYDKLATTLLAVLAFVVVLELLSLQLRQRPLRWTLGLAALGAVWALLRLDIPWADLWQAPGLSLLSLADLRPDVPFVTTVLGQTGDTLMMAWAATVLSALLAFVLAPLTVTPLLTASYLSDPPRRPLLSRLLRQAAKWASRAVLQLTRAMPELTLALVFVVWVGGGPLAGILAIAVHNMGVLGRLYCDVMEEVEPGQAAALQTQGASALGTYLFGVLPQVQARLAAFTLYRFECNVRATVMVGFVGAGGIGDALNTAISLFHTRDLSWLLLTMVTVVALVDAVGDHLRGRLLKGRHVQSVHTAATALPATPSHPNAFT